MKVMFSLLYTFCLHFDLNHIHFDYRLCRLLTEVPTNSDNQGSSVADSIVICFSLTYKQVQADKRHPI